MIGLRVGPFEIEREASVPLEGSWFLASRTGTTRRHPTHVLVKLLGPDAEQADRTALQAEFDALREVEDSRVPRAVGYYEGTGAMVVTAVGGAPLSALLDARATGDLPMTPATLCDLGLDLAECLQHAHHKARHHGHLDPDKIWLSPEGKLWIWGFGGPEPLAAAWTPPERARGLPAAAATDQWSLGALLAALITGLAPWEDVEQARRGALDHRTEAVEVQWPALGRLLRRMLDPEPARRFDGLGPVRQELLALSRKAGGLSERRELAITLAHRTSGTVSEPAPPADPPTPLEVSGTPTRPPTEDEVTVRQAPPPDSEPPDLAEAEARDLPLGRLASPGTLADEAIPVVGPDLTEDLPAAVVGEAENTKEPLMPGKSGDKSANGPDPADADTLRREPVVPEMSDEYGDGMDDDDADMEATQIVNSAAVQRAIAEARAAQGLDAAVNQDATKTLPPDMEDDGHHVESRSSEDASTANSKVTDAMRQAAIAGNPTNPTAVPWTDDGGAYGGAPKKRAPDGKVMLPEEGNLPVPIEPRPMPQNQRVALAAAALMVLSFLAYVALNM